MPAGTGNIAVDPRLASTSHLSATSPCRGAGSSAYATGIDIDGETWGIPPSIGCDEYHTGAVTGPLNGAIQAPYTNLAVGYTLGLTALIDGRTVASVWDFGDGLVVSNWPSATHAWTTAGDYTIVLRAYNESHPEGVTGSLAVHVTPVVYYVLAENPNPVAPYTNWATAAQTIQNAVDADVIPGAVVLVGDGQYSSGGRAVGNSSLVNRVAVTKPLAVRSVNGPQATTILGYQLPGIANGPGAIRCVYLTNGASLSGFTLSSGATLTNTSLTLGPYLDLTGGGVCCDSTNALITNCVLSGNSAYNYGGAAYEGTLFNCKLTGNWVSGFGGGASGSTLNGCEICSNSADSGGGVTSCILSNCVVTGNSASGFDGYGGGAEDSALTNCTVSGNLALWGGGGVFNGTLYNCTVSGNRTYNGPGGGALALWSGACTLYNCTLNNNSASWGGGGAAACSLYNCTLSGNSASYGGGAAGGTLYNCTVSGNSASYGGGVSANFGTSSSTLYNCIVYYNTAQNGTNYGTNCSLNYCCTTPLPTNGVGNITNAPLFVDYTNGNLRLQPNSPCINAGNNAYVTTSTDLDSKPRIVSGMVDIGAYEYQGTGFQFSFTTNYGTITITGYTGPGGSVTIPGTITGLPVTSIGDYAFWDCTSLTSVTIGNGVTSIGNWAFYSCANLSGVYFQGNAPSQGGSSVFTGDNNATVYYLPGTTGWGTTYGGRPTAEWWIPPAIQESPATQTAEAGSAVNLCVDAIGSYPLFYIWYRNTTNLVACSTNYDLELTNVLFPQSGTYSVVVSNVLGAVTSAPGMLNVIPPVERRPVPGVLVTGETGSLLNVDYADSLSRAPNWTTLGSVSLTSTSQYYFDLTLPLPPQRFYRAWQTGTPSMMPSLDLHLVPAITLTGNAGSSWRLDYINQFGPTDAWATLGAVTLTNTSQLYFDVSAPGQPQRLYRLVPLP